MSENKVKLIDEDQVYTLKHLQNYFESLIKLKNACFAQDEVDSVNIKIADVTKEIEAILY